MKKLLVLTIVMFCLGWVAAPMAQSLDVENQQEPENEIQYVDITTLIFIEEEVAQANLYEME